MQSTKIEPLREFYEYIKSIQDGHHKWAEFATGFPLSDVSHCRPSLMYYSNEKIPRNNDFNELFQSVITLRSEFNSKLYLPNQAVKFAKSSSTINDTSSVSNDALSPGKNASKPRPAA